MISLLRRIRQKLIDSGSVTKYMLYAIGEILLVVAGILIALQVNNWNLERQDRQKEQEVLMNLKVEFEANLFDLQRVLNQHKIIFSELKEIQSITLNGRYDDPRLDSLTHAFIKWYTFTDRPGASTNLIGSGNLNLISDEALRDLITQWSGSVADIVDDEVYTADFIRDTMLPFIIQRYPIANLEPENIKMVLSYPGISAEPDFKLDPVFDPVVPVAEVDWESLLENEEFQSMVAMRKIYEMHCILEIMPVEKICLQILELINKELGV